MTHFLQCAVMLSLSSPSSSSTGFRNCIASKSGISSNLANTSNTTPKRYASLSNKLYHFTVVCLVAWPPHDSEAEVDLGQATKHTKKNWSIVQGLNPTWPIRLCMLKASSAVSWHGWKYSSISIIHQQTLMWSQHATPVLFPFFLLPSVSPTMRWTHLSEQDFDQT